LRPLLLLPLLILVTASLSGCSVFDQLRRPDYHVAITEMAQGPDQWNRDNRFEVRVDEGVNVQINATATDGREVGTAGLGDVTLRIPDGTWAIHYAVGGYEWGNLDGVQIDTTPPQISGLEVVGSADASHSYVLGVGARISGASGLTVTDLQTGAVLGTTLPLTLRNLADGLQAFLVAARDEASNFANATVQVRVGTAADLPAGRNSFGVVARYTNSVRLWDLTRPQEYLSPEAARQAVGGDYLGAGYGITPTEPAVTQIVSSTVTSGMNTAQAALALYHWFADHLQYDRSRLEASDLLTPREVILDSEDPNGLDANHDGLVDDSGTPGHGNGVHGGVCRELAATFVSLLRAAGVPARLVSGYVAGNVNGFHAWVEFYAGAVAGQSPWMPIDVSSIDGSFSDSVLLQSFGILQPEYLALREIPSAAEVQGWSAALGVSYPQSPPGQPAPVITFADNVTDTFSHVGTLCFNPTTHARRLADTGDACGPGYGFFLAGFIKDTERIIDYGVLVERAPAGMRVTASVAYPFPDSVTPNDVIYQFYPSSVSFTKDTNAGKAVAQFTA
jgi:hypothetical protein